MDAIQLADRYWDQLLELNPLLGTQAGDERFDDRLPDLTPAGIEGRRHVHITALTEARRLRPMAASVWDRLACDTVEAIAEPEVRSIDLGLIRLTPVDHLWGPGTLLEQFASLQRADTPKRLERYLRRLEAMRDYLEAARDMLGDTSSAVTGPGVVVDRCLRQAQAILDTKPENSPALQPIPESDHEGRARAVDVLRSHVLPAFREYAGGLRDYASRARESLGLGGLSRGDEMYSVCIQRYTSLPLAASEIHELGVRELAAIQEERSNLARQLGAADPPAVVAAHVASGEDSFSSRDDIIHLAQDQVERGWDRARAFFGKLPERNCEVRPIDPSREADVLEHYFPATPDGTRPPVYYVNTANASTRERHSLATTTFHEANPGHHLQVSLEQLQMERPILLRLGGELAGSAFIEGWGLYAERLADEMDLYLDDYERLGMLELQALRAARLVVDTGLHALGWSRQQTIETLESTGLPNDRAVLETDRYIAMPGQALAYKIGQLEIEAARKREEAALGSSFQLADFHDRLLSLGSMPLASFRRELAAIPGDQPHEVVGP